LALASLQLVAGPLADRFGRRRATVGGLALLALGGIGAAAAPSIGVLIAARAVQGVGGAFVLTGALGLVAVQFPDGDRLKVLALRSAIIATAFAIGPLAGGVLTDLLGWRSVFAFDAALAVPLLLVLARGQEELGPGRAARLDPPGLVALAVTMLAVVFVVIRGNAQGWTSGPIVVALAVTVVGAVTVAVRQRAGHHLVPVELLRDRSLAASVLALMALYVTVFGGFIYVTIFLRTVGGLGPAATGGLLVSFAVASLAAVLVVTRSPHRDRLDRLVPGSLLLAALGLVAVALAAPSREPVTLIPGLVLVGLASGIVNPILTASQIAAFKPSDGGIAAGLNGASRQFGTALGTAVLGAVVLQAIGRRLVAVGDLAPAVRDRIAAGDLDAGLAAVAAPLRPIAEEAYRAGLVHGLQVATLGGAAVLLGAAALTARWLGRERAARDAGERAVRSTGRDLPAHGG